MFVFESVAIRLVSLAIPVVLVWWLPYQLAVTLFMVLGQGHFLLAYWYQKDAGKWNGRKLIFLLAGFFLLLWLSGALSFLVFAFLTGVIFFVHMVFDELYLLKGPISVFSTLEATPFVLIYSALLADALFSLSTIWYALGLSCVVLLVYGVCIVRAHRTPNVLTWIYLGWTLAALAAYALFYLYADVSPVLWFLGLTVVHYGIWYGEYWRKVRTKPSVARTYMTRVFALNAVLLCCGFLWLIGVAPVFSVLFGYSFFYVWAFLHIVTSIRIGDMRSAIRLTA